MAYIKVENLKYRYPNTTKLALDGLDFEIEKGSFIGIVGENGAGKSTLVNLACRFFEPTGVQRSYSEIFQRSLWRKSSDRGH